MAHSPMLPARRTAFLHFFDVHFLQLKKAHLMQKQCLREAQLATRLAYLAMDEILVPAASFFESEMCRQVISTFRPLYDAGAVWMVGSGANIEEFIYTKLKQYPKGSTQYRAYKSARLQDLPPFLTRGRSATQDIIRDWRETVEAQDTGQLISDGTRYSLPLDFEDRWARVPEQLEEKAFIVDHVAPLLVGDDVHPTIISRLHYIINESYFRSYVQEFSAATVGGLVYLESPHPVPSYGRRIPYKWLREETRRQRILKTIIGCNVKKLCAMREDPKWMQCLSVTEQAWDNGDALGLGPMIESTSDEKEATDMRTDGKRFRVALSFPGEHRSFVESVAACLANHIGQENVFYDKYYEAELARVDLDTYLQDIYHKDSDLIVVFLCADYERKEWCKLEWRAIRDLIKKRQLAAIMLCRFDNTEISGLFSTDGYVAIEGRDPEEVAQLILQRLAHNTKQDAR